jgi:hypothetical protein
MRWKFGKYENYEKRWQGQIGGPIFTNAGDNTLLCLVSSLTEYIKESTKNEIEYFKWSMYVEQSTQNEIEYNKWSLYIKILVRIANNMLKKWKILYVNQK